MWVSENNDAGHIILVLKKAYYIQEQMIKYPHGISLAKLTSLVKMNKSSVFRILATLKNLGYVVQFPENSKYCLSRKHLLLGASADIDLKTIVRPYLETIAQETNELCHLVVREGNVVICIDKVEGNRQKGNNIHITSYIGKPSYMHCSSVGKLFLAHLSETEVKSVIEQTGLIKRTNNTITDYDVLKRHLAQIRAQGYSVDNMEDQENVRCIALPIYNAQGSLIAAIGLSGTILTFTEQKIPELVIKLRTCTQELSKALGYTVPEHQ